MVKKKKFFRPIIYLYIYAMVRWKIRGNIVQRYQLNEWIGRIVRLPKFYRSEIIDELVKMGLLKKINRDNFQIQNLQIKKLDNIIKKLEFPLWAPTKTI